VYAGMFALRDVMPPWRCKAHYAAVINIVGNMVCDGGHHFT